jgi:predicted dehydrogenase
MALDLTAEQKEVGKDNFRRAADGLTRRDLMKSLMIGTAGLVPVAAAGYFGYEKLKNGNAVKAAIIGTGDEGGVLIGDHPPDFLEMIAVCDIRPSNLRRIFDGEAPPSPRKGLKKIYGNNCDKSIKQYKAYDDFCKALRENKDIEAVVIALPLSWHAKAACDFMRIGKERGKPVHVLCEKLMAWNIKQCKKMIEVAKETGSILSIGHQRHYSLLYAHAVEMINSGVLGDVRHIRALWHRNNSWPYEKNAKLQMVAGTEPQLRDGWFPPVLQEDYDALNGKLKEYGYDSVEQLVRWRLYNATGGGLMAELGSHQLDACSIFLGKVHPLAVTGVGGKTFYRKGKNDRDCEDHVFVSYEFPGKNYANDKDDIVVVTYSSISTNQFEPYGECVMGSRGTMVVEQEATLMLYPERDPKVKVAGTPRSLEVSVTKSGQPAIEATSTWGGPVAARSGEGPAGTGGPVSRGYKEEMEDFAYCIRMWDPKLGYQEKPAGERKDKRDKYAQRLPRCHGEVAMADAIVALTANQSMRKHERIVFNEKWFDADSTEVPDGKEEPKVPVT